MGKIRAIVAFGSRARGDGTGSSDLDVLVFAPGVDDPLLVLEEVQARLPAQEVDVHLFSPNLKPTLAFEILRDARVLYEREPGQGALSLAEVAMLVEPPPPPFNDFLEVKKMGVEETLRKSERRLASLERKKAGLTTRIAAVSWEAFLADEMLQEFAFARLYKMAQEVIDLAALLIALEGRIPPPEGPERLEVLGEMRLVTQDLSSRLVRIARFRNGLAHIYEELDLVRLYRFASEEVRDIDAFVEAVKAYLVSRLS
ncbi:MAG: type VII toxin-antitoxin system HepT family RNase toxin [Candidatus Methylomirabilales bacterium]